MLNCMAKVGGCVTLANGNSLHTQILPLGKRLLGKGIASMLFKYLCICPYATRLHFLLLFIAYAVIASREFFCGGGGI